MWSNEWHVKCLGSTGKATTMNIKAALVPLGILLVSIGVSAQQRIEPPTESQKLIDSIQGPELFKAYCAVCHGNDAKGSGPMAGSLKASPPDLTRIAARSGGRFPFVRVQRIISGEEPMQAGHGPREMPVW